MKKIRPTLEIDCDKHCNDCHHLSVDVFGDCFTCQLYHVKLAEQKGEEIIHEFEVPLVGSFSIKLSGKTYDCWDRDCWMEKSFEDLELAQDYLVGYINDKLLSKKNAIRKQLSEVEEVFSIIKETLNKQLNEINNVSLVKSFTIK